MKVEDCFYFGKIGKPKGFKGEVNIIIDRDSPTKPNSLDEVFVLIGKKLVPYPFIQFKLTPKGNALARFEGLNSDLDVNRIKNLSLYLPKSILPVLDRDDYYLHDLIGCKLIDQSLGYIGLINEVNSQTAQKLLFVDTNKEEIVIPFVDDFIVKIDIISKEVTLDLPKGIVDLNE